MQQTTESILPLILKRGIVPSSREPSSDSGVITKSTGLHTDFEPEEV